MVSVIVALLAILGFVSTSSFSAMAASSAADTHVTINGGKPLRVISTGAIGINNAVWDGGLLDSALPGLLTNAGIKVMRYPGGSTSDVYHWQTNTTEVGQSYANPNNTFDAFMGLTQKVGASPMITVNYGSGTPAEAAGWVQYANITKHYGVKYWEIGNELYGNGTYGANWEYDLHAQKSATAYANNALQFIQAMKAVDPTIKIGVVLTVPGDWPDNIIAPGDMGDWNHTVLSILGTNVDFADQHWYADYVTPGNESDPILLRNAAQAIPEKVAATRAELVQYAGKKGASMPIMITETNSVPYNPGKQTVSLVNALFLATDYMNWLENGITNVDWWATHNSIVTYGNNSASLYGTTQYGDYGVLSSGGSSNGLSEPPADTPFPTYYGLQLVHDLIGNGGVALANTSDQSLVEAHVVRHFDGSLAVMLINKDPSNSYTVALSAKGAFPGRNATVYTYGENSTSVSMQQEDGLAASSPTIAPYSITTIVFHS
jgi:hypothetical protein